MCRCPADKRPSILLACLARHSVPGRRNIPLSGLLKVMPITPSPIVWKTAMAFAAIAVLLYSVWGPY
jgi:hypothetical protein